MIIGGRIDSVEGKKEKEDGIEGLNINIAIDNVKIDNDKFRLEINYTYTANYAVDIGYMKIKGSLFAEEDKALLKEIDDAWKKNKKLPDNYLEGVLSSINYAGSANGTLVARVLNLSPPLVPPKISVAKAK